MKRHAIFVDAGYVFAQGAVSLVGKKISRAELKLNQDEVIRQLKILSAKQSEGVQLLRVYWYDGARNGPTSEHLALANMTDVKLRLGSINSSGEQKEVDSLLVTDLIDLARNQSICDATVVAGDADVRIAVQIAQGFGVRVHLIGLEPSRVSQSPSLRQEADTTHEISRGDVSRFLRALPAPPSSPSATPLIEMPSTTASSALESPVSSANMDAEKDLSQIVDEAAERVFLRVGAAGVVRLKEALAASSAIPEEFDRHLLGTCRALIGRDLMTDERRRMRSMFVEKIRKPQNQQL